MNKKLARIFTCLMAFSFALQLSPAAATSNHLDVQDISQNVAPEGDGPETEYPPDFPDERLDPEFEAHFEIEQDRHYQDHLLNADLPEEVIAPLKTNSEPLEEREYVPPTAEEIDQTRVQAEIFDCNTVTDIPATECEALVALYEGTNGAGWKHQDNWLVPPTADNWYGVTVNNEHVTNLELGWNQLSGEIPPELSSLTNLYRLYLYSNQLSGEIPASLGSLSDLRTLDLSYNQLTGSIPTSLGSLTNLRYLHLYSNQLSSSIPTSLGSLTNLQVLYLSGNQLSEEIPAELGNLTYLDYLDLSDNQLSGSIPTDLGSLTNLEYLDLSGNQLSGEIPASLGSLTNLQYLYLYSNQLSGAIPASLGSLINLYELDLNWNQLSGAIPLELGNLLSLISLNLRNNALSGDVPASFTNLVNLCDPDNYSDPCYGYYQLDLGYNHLNVPAPEPLASFLAIKDPDWYLTQAVEVVIQGESGGTLISNDEYTEIIIPPGAANGEVTFLFDPQPTPTHAIDRRSDFAGNSFELTAWDETEQPVTTFAPPLVITISYDEGRLGRIPEDRLILYYWDETQAAWLDAVTTCDDGEYTRNLAEDWLSLPICHLSEFALLGDGYPLFLPLITR